MRFLNRIIVAALAVFAFAAPATAQIGVWMPQAPGMTFGGNGIVVGGVMQNANWAQSGITLGLAAHERFVGPLADNGAGTFYAPAGPDPLNSSYARWNWNFFVDVAPNNQRLRHELWYDFDPAANNALSTFGRIDFVGNAQNSWNNGMSFLGLNPNGPAGSFDFNANGTYKFRLRSFVAGDLVGANPLAEAEMAVVVGNPQQVVPEPSTYALVVAGLAMTLGIARRRRVA